MRFLLLLILLACPDVVFSQNPYHFFLGSEELTNVDIYGISQTPDGKYWLATNKGLYSYNGYQFQAYANKLQLSNSVFNLKLDKEGRIYCNNLNGQIFKFENDSLTLFHAIPDSLRNPYSDFDFLPDNSLFIRGLHSYRLKNGEISNVIEIVNNANTHTFVSSDCQGNLISNFNRDSIFRISNNSIEKSSMPNISNELLEVVKFFCHKNQLYACKGGNRIFEVSKQGKYELELKPILDSNIKKARFYATSNHFWFAENVLGVRVYNSAQTGNNFDEQKMFGDKFISTVFEDKRGNILLGTFGEGMIVIPKMEVANNLFPNMEIVKFSLGDSGTIYLANKQGEVFAFEGNRFKKIYKSKSSRVELLRYFPKQKALFIMGDELTIIRTDSKKESTFLVSSIKDVLPFGEDKFMLSNNYTVFYMENFKTQPKLKYHTSRFGRSYSIAYQDTSTFMVGTNSGLKSVDRINQSETKTAFKGNEVIANRLEYLDSTLLVSTVKYGLLKMENGELKTFADKKSGLHSNSINQFRIFERKIFVATEKGFQMLDSDGNLLGSLGISDGLKTTRINDFQIREGYIWLLHQFGLQKIPLENLLEENAYKSKIGQITLLANGKEKTAKARMHLNHDQNQITLQIFSPSLERQADLEYHYKLDGIEADWLVRDYRDNQVEYKSLPPGNYQFQLILKYKGKVQDSKKIIFSIQKPFWQTSWFLVLCGVGIALAFYLYFKRRISSLQQKSRQLQELNAMRMRALQSQLDPHFVFNALNCVQNIVLDGNATQANYYLVGFSKLMRLVLENSRREYIPLEEEIEVIMEYMNLQKIYYTEGFSYHIEVADEIDIEDIMIPPMFVQPFLENTLEHGILGKNGKIVVSFKLREKMVLVEVTDNGVGISQALKNKNPEHKSLATEIIKERIESYNEKLGTDTKLLIYEIEDENGKVMGTKVEFGIPYVRHY